MDRCDRREFLRRAGRTGLSAGGLALLTGCDGASLPRPSPRGEPPPETTSIKVHHSVSLCMAPQYVAEELLRAEGFSDVRYVTYEEAGGFYPALTSGAADIGNDFATVLIMQLEAGAPITVLGGLHVGCFELFGTEEIRTISHLKGRTVAVRGLDLPPYLFLASMAAYVGLDPSRDINWLVLPSTEAIRLLAAGQVDAFMGFPPEPQELRASGIGRVVVRSAVDRPWSQYFCCMTVANRDFVRRNPIAAKRAQRAILKAADICALEPSRAAQSLMDRGVAKRYDLALQTVTDVSYGKWREYDPEDTIRFYALRLHEIGMIKSNPATVIDRGTDWRSFNELKRELKV